MRTMLYKGVWVGLRECIIIIIIIIIIITIIIIMIYLFISVIPYVIITIVTHSRTS